MSSPGGPCERCGGPTVWTVVRGEMFVACGDDCLEEQLDAFGRNPPLVALLPERAGDRTNAEVELIEGMGVVPCEGGEARMTDTFDHEPPVGWLSTLWVGGSGDGAR